MAPRSGFAAFIDAVAKINHDVNPDYRIDNEAKQLVGLHIHGLIKDICTRVSEVTAEKSRVEYTDIVGVLPSFFIGDILALAHDEGSRRLNLHFSGMLPFNPKKPPKPGHKKEDTALLNIMRASVSNFIASKHNAMGIESFDEGCTKLATIMFHIAKYLQSALSDISREENLLEVDENHVQLALGDALPEDLRQHAIYHSKTNVEKYVKGEYKYDVTETISKLIPPVSMKKTTQKRKKVAPTTEKPAKRKTTSASVSARKSEKAPTTRKKVKAAKETTAPKPVKRKRRSSATSSKRKTSATPKPRKAVKRKARSHAASSKRKVRKTSSVSSGTKTSPAPKPRKTVKRKRQSPAASSQRKVRKTAPRKKKSTKRTAPKVKKPTKKMAAPPLKSASRKRKSKEDKHAPEDARGRPDFTRGILEFFGKKEKQRIAANTPGIQEINSFIGDVCDSLIEELNRQKPSLTTEKVRIAVERLLPGNLAQHALSNVAQALLVSSSMSSSA